MTPRERNLLIALGAILATFLAGYAGFRYWYQPWSEYNAAIEILETENLRLDAQLRLFHTERPKLSLARRRSLSLEPNQAAAEYEAYLRSLFAKAGLTGTDTSPTAPPKFRVVNPIVNVKEVGHQAVALNVGCTGELSQLVKALEQMARTPYEHRIKSLTIGRADQTAKKDASTKLKINMSIEILLVAKTENKPGLPPGAYPYVLLAPQIQAPVDFALLSTVAHQLILPILPDRDYADIAKRNIFVGALPPVPTEPPGPTESEKPKVKIPEYVYLTTCIPDEKTAYLHNRLYSNATTPEMRLVAKEGTSHDIFEITGPPTELGKYLYFRAKILKVELRQIFFQIGNGSDTEFVKDGVYSLQIGQPLANAKFFSENYSKIDLEDLGLYSRDFEKAELNNYLEKKKNEANDNNGRGTKRKPGKR